MAADTVTSTASARHTDTSQPLELRADFMPFFGSCPLTTHFQSLSLVAAGVLKVLPQAGQQV